MLEEPSNLRYFHELGEQEPEEPYAALERCLSMDEEFAVLMALRILGLLTAYVFRRSRLPVSLINAGRVTDLSPKTSFLHFSRA